MDNIIYGRCTIKWFKHISDSLDDPFIQDLIDEFGSDGYLVFFGTLEIISREFNIKSPGIVEVSRRYFTRKVRLSWHKCSTILKFCENEERFFVKENGRRIEINCPKLKDLCDNWTSRLLQSDSVAATEELPNQAEAEAEAEADLALKRPYAAPQKDEIKNASSKKLNEDIEIICKELYEQKIFPEVHAFKNKMLKLKKNKRALLHTLVRCHLKKTFEKGAYPYCLQIMKVEEGNFNEQDSNRTS